ncbi:unnamed protein product, partial [Callosobruchus maculatus]
SIAPCVISL